MEVNGEVRARAALFAEGSLLPFEWQDIWA
jgi:hypothetical protein